MIFNYKKFLNEKLGVNKAVQEYSKRIKEYIENNMDEDSTYFEEKIHYAELINGKIINQEKDPKRPIEFNDLIFLHLKYDESKEDEGLVKFMFLDFNAEKLGDLQELETCAASIFINNLSLGNISHEVNHIYQNIQEEYKDFDTLKTSVDRYQSKINSVKELDKVIYYITFYDYALQNREIDSRIIQTYNQLKEYFKNNEFSKEKFLDKLEETTAFKETYQWKKFFPEDSKWQVRIASKLKYILDKTENKKPINLKIKFINKFKLYPKLNKKKSYNFLKNIYLKYEKQSKKLKRKLYKLYDLLYDDFNPDYS